MEPLKLLLTLTLSGSALTILLLALRYLILKKMPSTVYYYAWLLVLLRFTLPLPGLVPTGSDVAAGGDEAVLSRPAVTETERRNDILLRPAAESDTLPDADVSQPVRSDESVIGDSDDSFQAQSVSERKDVSMEPGLTWSSPLLWIGIWLVGALFSLAGTVFAYLRFARRLNRTLRVPDRFTRGLYAALPGRKPELYRSAALKTPVIYGLVRPKIVLPDWTYDEEQLQNILRHELTHYRRFDTLYKWISVFVLSGHWFNPLSWLVRRELNRSCELSCDEMLLRSMSREEKKSYGNTLLSMAASGALPAGVVATTFCTEKKNLKERLEQIMTYQKKNRTRALAAVLALVLLAGCGAAAGPSQTEIEPAAPSDGTSVSNDGRPIVHVSSVDEFLAAIAPDTIIELEAGIYHLPGAADYSRSTDSPYYLWSETYDGYQLTIFGVSNLTLTGAGMGETVISTDPRYADVIHFRSCSSIQISDLTAGHTREPGYCAGGVLYFDNSEDISIDRCGLYGCGTIGVWASECARLTVTDSDIYECSYNAVNLSSCRDVTVTGCDVYGHGTRSEEMGSAISVFAADFSDNVRFLRNSIHDNCVQYLLQLNAVKNAMFLSNEVTGNRLITSYFAFQRYGPTVDGCSFSGNESLGGWYSGGEGRIYASDAEGNLLDPAALERMTYADMDPDTVSPAKSPAAPTEAAPGETIVVTGVDDFLSAIGPDRTIVLDGGLFDLAAAASYGSLGGEYWYWQESYDGPELVIENVSGLSIRGASALPKDTVLSATPRYANVLNFRNCTDITLTGFTAGHTREPGSCAGGVLHFADCGNVTVDSMRLYGCGILGIQTSQCRTLSVLRTEIYECSQGAGHFYATEGIRFEDCSIHDVPSPALNFTDCENTTWNGDSVDSWSSSYNVADDGSLTAFTYEGYVYEGDFLHEYAVVVPEDPFAGDVQMPFSEVPAALTFAETVQKLIAEGDWEALADWLDYPLTILGESENYSVASRERFLDDYAGYLNEGFCQRIFEASLDRYGTSLYGNTFCGGYLAFVCRGSVDNPEDFRLSCISIVSPLR